MVVEGSEFCPCCGSETEDCCCPDDEEEYCSTYGLPADGSEECDCCPLWDGCHALFGQWLEPEV